MDFKLKNIPTQQGRIAIVTGANNGIGFETTLAMAKYGFKVVMACRNMAKAEKAKSAILQKSPDADLDILQLDLSDLNSVRAFAKNFKNNYSKLNVLINNAGVLIYSGKKNGAGIELQFATNHLGHFLLTNLLIDLMPDDAASRIVALSSIAHKTAKIHFDDLNGENIDDAEAVYGQSKLANLMFADALNRQLKQSGKKMVALAVHPGGSDSGLFDEMSKVKYYTFKILSPFILNSNASAAKPSLFAALSTDVQGGEYFGPQGFNEFKGKVGVAKRSDYSKREDVATRLWQLSEKLTGQPFIL
ncbi:oxidoreductase [Allomuricauda sp. SCSIO 65647]|uniref:oxidoreductase n=1 Tax=Allomuricauda sp. SCSIO 65647 TaxID=2908843 RepID=UPI001F43FD5B|nr:oxidoreductase [Muricauda sp. SCSIO 65647]UJH67348.1 oxidoreductase [Muricauda sp. SCSIO 65647]